jgi:hypothetical protein
MSKIVLRSSLSNVNAITLSKLKKVTNMGFRELNKNIQNGTPFYEVILFMNNHEEIAQRLRDIVKIFDDAKIPLDVFELEPDEEFDKCPLHECKISTQVLENILSEWKYM